MLMPMLQGRVVAAEAEAEAEAEQVLQALSRRSC
jgi:hypothetical protein